MQKNLIHLFFREGSLTNTLLRINLFVSIVIFSTMFASAKSYDAKIESQENIVTGTVTDQQGLPEIGVTIVVKGTTNGTVTDAMGKFTLTNVSPNATLVFSFIGLETEEIPLNGRTQIDVVMKEKVISLDEVVVVGYGVEKKASVVGAISQVSNEELKMSGDLPDLAQALEGKLPGVTVLTASGEPGGTGRGTSSTSIYIRGQNTWNGASPLILVDGIERNIDNLDVSEVENVSVLKDASATAVFGVKGANGVILVTTKRGKIGKPKISFTFNGVGQMVSKVPTTLNSFDAIMTHNQTIERGVSNNEATWAGYTPYDIALRYKQPQLPQYKEIYPDVNWEKAILKDVGYSEHATLNISGGTNFVQYFGSISYMHQGDMLKHYANDNSYNPSNDFTRFNFRSNLDFKLTNTTKLSVNLSGYYSVKNGGWNWENAQRGYNDWTWGAIYTMAPDLYLPKYSDGYWGWDKRVDTNPIALNWNQGILQRHVVDMNSDFALEQKLDFITKGLSARASLSYDKNILTEGGVYDLIDNIDPSDGNIPIKIINPLLYTGPTQDPNQYTTYYPSKGLNQFGWVRQPWILLPEVVGQDEWNSTIPVERRLNYQFQLNYARKFGLHNVSALGMVKREEYAIGSMFANYREDWVFRATYDYATKYLFEANGAYNGSEQFGPGYRFHFFPSVALGWVVTNEKFFHEDWLKVLNKLKLRYSIGTVGNDQVAGSARWLYSSQYSYGGTTILNQNIQTNSPYTWYKESVVGNPDIHWETALKKNLGVEVGLFNNLISLTYDYFTENRTDILIAGSDRTIPSYFGAIPPSANLGAVNSKGHELVIRFDKRTKAGIHYWASLALTHTENKILKRDDPLLRPAYLKASGYSIGQTTTSITAGFMNNWDDVYASTPFETNDLTKLPGYYNILDFKPDGTIKGSSDSEPYGYSSVPQNTFDASFGADYKGFSFMVEFYGATNVSRYMGDATYFKNTDLYFTYNADYWSKNNPNAATYLRQAYGTSGIISGNNLIADASFLRLKNVNIGYTFSDKWVKKAGLSGLKIYLNGNNLMFWSKLPDDRESVYSGGDVVRGTYPTVKLITGGAELTF